MAHQHHHDYSNTEQGGITMAFWLNLAFSVVEIIGGILTNSTAIIADAFHDFMDAGAIGLAVILEKISGRSRTANFSYGYRRFSLLSALIMSILLLVGAVIMAISAVKSFINPEVVNSSGMLILAVLGILVNGAAFLRLRGDQKKHSDSTQHNSRAIMLHLLEDVLGWIAVLVGATLMFFTDWYWIDSVLTMAIAIFIAYNATGNLISTMKVLLQSVPENVNIPEVRKELSTINGVDNIHDFHVWSLDGSYNVATIHIVISTSCPSSKDSICNAAREVMEKHRIQHPTIQVESCDAQCNLQHC